jgi:hypothetical protein
LFECPPQYFEKWQRVHCQGGTENNVTMRHHLTTQSPADLILPEVDPRLTISRKIQQTLVAKDMLYAYEQSQWINGEIPNWIEATIPHINTSINAKERDGKCGILLYEVVFKT